MPLDIPKPWGAFLRDLDRELGRPSLTRPTADIDVLVVRPQMDLNPIAGIGSSLHKKHRVYVQLVTVVEAYPEDYEERLTEMLPGAFRNLELPLPSIPTTWP